MIIGVPKEIKNRENRVGLVPAGVRALVEKGHKVWIQKSAGVGSGIVDEQYLLAGAKIVDKAEDIWQADMIVKVKEPLKEEFKFLRPNQTLFTFLHLAAESELTQRLLEAKVTAIAYETIQEEDKTLPLLRPMSEVAGKMAVQEGAFYLKSSWTEEHLGKGILLGGVPGVMPGQVTILGAGVAGSNAAKVALGMGAQVTLIDIDSKKLDLYENLYGGRLLTLMSNYDNIFESVAKADLFIGTILVPGAKAPKLVTREMIHQMSPGSVVVDVSVDQGGCVETCRPTSHEQPIFIEKSIIHYCVTNMPGAVARTSTYNLTNATLKYALLLANLGPEKCAQAFNSLKLGFNTYQGYVVHEQIALAHGLKYTPLQL